MKASRPIVFLLIASFFLPGCTRLVNHRIVEYSPGAPPATQPAPESAVYSVKLLDQTGKKLRGVEGSRYFLKKGDTIGFSTDESGKVHAVAGSYDLILDVPPSHSTVWSARYRIATQFGKEVNKAGDATMDTTSKVLIVLGLSALVGAAGYEWYRENIKLNH
ncbi:MAG TPA: hypothetical protein VGQ99_01545 [Tepidisphaeraceae bacterium]|jgi:hypothetical protein|nr:hypothetical protein [Tepidisphaeraceae bacterium]